MFVIRFFARLLLAPVFIYGGLNTLQKPGPRVEKVVSANIPSPELAVRANAWLMVGAGSMLAMGILPRIASGMLAGALVPTTLAGHPFWELQGQDRERQMTQFFKNTAALAGLILFTFGSD